MSEPGTGLRLPIRHRVVRQRDLPERQGVVAFLSSQERNGPWRLSPETRVVSVLGSVKLDLREVELGEGESVVEVFCLFGSVEVVVPPGIRILNEGDSLMGSFELQGGDWETDHAGPVVRITGSTYMGSVEIRQQAYGETPREARKRRKRLGKG